MYSKVHSGVDFTVYSVVFCTEKSKVLVTIDMKLGRGCSLGHESAQPETLMSDYSLLYSTVYCTVYSTVYSEQCIV